MRYDVLVAGNDEAGCEAALQAAETGRAALLVPPRRSVDGLHLLHAAERLVDASDRRELSLPALREQVEYVAELEADFQRCRLQRAGVDVLDGAFRFVAEDCVRLQRESGARVDLEADRTVLATGTRPSRPRRFRFDDERVFDLDTILKSAMLPRSLAIVGAGETGWCAARAFAMLGVAVTLVDEREAANLPHVDVAAAPGVELLAGAEAIATERTDSGGVCVVFASGGRLPSDAVLFCLPREGATDDLDLSAAGLEPDERGRLWVDDRRRTWVPQVVGAGDVVGFRSEDSARAPGRPRLRLHAEPVEEPEEPELRVLV